MTDLTQKLKRALEFDEKPIHYIGDQATNEAIYSAKGRAYENARLQPIHSALIECVAALEYYKNIHEGKGYDIEDILKHAQAINKLREVLK